MVIIKESDGYYDMQVETGDMLYIRDENGNFHNIEYLSKTKTGKVNYRERGEKKRMGLAVFRELLENAKSVTLKKYPNQ